ncbi:hypothetical protein LTR35_001540 [Friedmanniomyces endolithicus]|uniref:Mid2 domain-containing protein n=1 Tax=Friedmanniomyces endolithicus TaxID=329885 RepID=A0AAN6FQJ3_9PEZI|nr:hypothetical protein LTR35_001540 [Friedmanniomyces endolithicus]KAK0298025.1 hypothetical protein LTS00_003564 [Friedmanniomyces endolithicus]KAK0322610.1 hypothetical protein LTR82_006570 [Friedmanniomyces endolithicus]KAK0823884.1 hypothetical protein LTR73_008217 [Friedmanniomyces endolithicus]KAK1018319.1 hypothetical protein LTR54_001205 [Friedmanniomyces endolithicus]
MARLLLYGFVSLAYAQSCYWPAETQADSNWTPCDASQNVSHCCHAEDLCLNNGYCFAQAGSGNGFPNRLVRGACTDRSWQSSSCPQYCADVSAGGEQTIALVQDEANGWFCCGFGTLFFNGSNCTTATRGSNAPFNLHPELAILDRSNGATTLSTAAGATAVTGGTASTVTSTVVVTANAASLGATGSGGSTSVVAVGAGVAVPLGILLIAVSAIAVLLWRRNKRLIQQMDQKDRQYQAQSAYDTKDVQSAYDTQRAALLPVSEVDGTSIVPELAANERGLKRGRSGK